MAWEILYALILGSSLFVKGRQVVSRSQTHQSSLCRSYLALASSSHDGFNIGRRFFNWAIQENRLRQSVAPSVLPARKPPSNPRRILLRSQQSG